MRHAHVEPWIKSSNLTEAMSLERSTFTYALTRFLRALRSKLVCGSPEVGPGITSTFDHALIARKLRIHGCPKDLGFLVYVCAYRLKLWADASNWRKLVARRLYALWIGEGHGAQVSCVVEHYFVALHDSLAVNDVTALLGLSQYLLRVKSDFVKIGDA